MFEAKSRKALYRKEKHSCASGLRYGTVHIPRFYIFLPREIPHERCTCLCTVKKSFTKITMQTLRAQYTAFLMKWNLYSLSSQN